METQPMEELLNPPKIHFLGGTTLLISWRSEINSELLYRILSLKNEIETFYKNSRVEVYNTYSSIAIKYFDFQVDLKKEKERITELLKSENILQLKQVNCFELPVCYDEEFGLDLKEISRIKELSIPEIITLHTTPEYTIYFQGFLPGFLYLGGLDERLRISRKAEPRMNLLKGSVGLAENQTGIYPRASAGGWQLIGNCPIDLFNADQQLPSPFKPGDRLRFVAVSKKEHHQLKKAVEKGTYPLKAKIREL